MSTADFVVAKIVSPEKASHEQVATVVMLNSDGGPAARRLRELEGFISRGFEAFYDVGSALREIRGSGFYKSILKYERFENYCRDRWGISRVHAHRLIGAADLRDNLLPIGNTLPANEAQARVLVKLPPPAQRKAWEDIVENQPLEGVGVITAKSIEAVARKYQPRQRRQVEPEEPVPAYVVQDWTLWQAIEKLHLAVETVAKRWPKDQADALANKLRSLADEAPMLMEAKTA